MSLLCFVIFNSCSHLPVQLFFQRSLPSFSGCLVLLCFGGIDGVDHGGIDDVDHGGIDDVDHGGIDDVDHILFMQAIYFTVHRSLLFLKQ